MHMKVIIQGLSTKNFSILRVAIIMESTSKVMTNFRLTLTYLLTSLLVVIEVRLTNLEARQSKHPRHQLMSKQISPQPTH